MKIIVLPGRDHHYSRITQPLQALGFDVKTTFSPGECFDFALVSPSHKGNIPMYDRVMFFDAEDDPRHFDPDEAYTLLKDKAEAYVKIGYIENDADDNIKRIAAPIAPYFTHRQVAGFELEPFSHKHAIPVLVAAPTFMGHYQGVYSKVGESLAEYEPGNMIYNQRYQWLKSMEDANIPYHGGIVFGEQNLSLEWQTKYHGPDVARFKVPRAHNYHQLLNTYRVGLCPTGHERLSWRVFDIMAMGSILISTDRCNQRNLYNPVGAYQIGDHEDLGIFLLNSQRRYKEMWEACQPNRDVLAGLTDEKIWDDFLAQLD